MKIVFYLTFLLFSLGQLGRISFFGQQINIYVYEIILCFLFFFLFLNYGLLPLTSSFDKFKTVYLFFLIMIFSFLHNINHFSLFENFVGFLYIIRLWLYFNFFLYLSFYLKKHKNFIRVIKRGVITGLSIISIITVFQYFFYPDLRNLYYLGWDPHLYRAFGLFFDTSVAAAIYGLGFLFVYNNSLNNLSKKILLGACFGFLLLTFSRAGYLALLISFSFLLLKQKKYKQLILFSLVFIMVFFALPKPFGEGINLKRLFSLKSRVIDYQTAFKIFRKYPILGVGYNRIRYIKKRLNFIDETSFPFSHAGASFHSSYLVVLVSLGIFGILIMLKMLSDLKKLKLMKKSYFLFIGIMSFFDNIFLHPFVLFFLIVILFDRK